MTVRRLLLFDPLHHLLGCHVLPELLELGALRLVHVHFSGYRALQTDEASDLATRADMVAAGWTPSVRLFEAGAIGAPVISESWLGIASSFEPGTEILLPDSTDAVVEILTGMRGEERRSIGEALRVRVLAEHTSDHRAEELEAFCRFERELAVPRARLAPDESTGGWSPRGATGRRNVHLTCWFTSFVISNIET